MYEVAIGYIVGSAASLLIFQRWIRERIITGTLDMLIEEDYVRSWIDDDGVVQLSKLNEGMTADISPEAWSRFEKLMDEIAKEKAEDESP